MMSNTKGQTSTKLYAQLVKLTELSTMHQKAIEELTNKVLLLAQNLNTQTFRLMVTERLMREKLGITPDEVMQAGLGAIEDDRQQRTEELEKEQQQGQQAPQKPSLTSVT